MNKISIIALLAATELLVSCSPIKTAVSNQYKLESFSAKKIAQHQTHVSLLVSQPDAIAGYQTEQMMYTNKPFELTNFAHSAWISSPANMLYPLIIQSLQTSHYFYAIASGPDADKTDYRLDTQLFELRQNFLSKPSRVQLVAKVVLTHIADNRVVSSRIITKTVPCPQDTPYGGVLAANQASLGFTAALSNFVIEQVKQDNLGLRS